MAKLLCELVIQNKKNATRSVGRSILGPKQRGICKFYTVGQIKDALAIERFGSIDILSDIPESLGLSKFKKETEEEAPAVDNKEVTDKVTDEKAPVADNEEITGGATEEDNGTGNDELIADSGNPAANSEPATEEEAAEETAVNITASLTRDEVIAMSKKELLAYAKENSLEFPGANNRSNASEVTNAALTYYGYATLGEEEKF